MLDLSHPQAKHVIKAARLEDEIRICLVEAKQNHRALEDVETIRVLRILEELDALNIDHFASNAGIASTIEGLKASVRGGDTEIIWNRFLELADAPGDNFGTWVI